jgi:hypothetical protein
MKCLLLPLALILAAADPPAQPPTAPLLSLIEGLTPDSDSDAAEAVVRAALEEGSMVIPQLTRLLASKQGIRSGAAALALAFSGSPDAPRALLDHHNRHPGSANKSIVCFVLPQRASAGDVRFLVRSLRGEHYGSTGPPIEAAALALGIIRDASAVPALEATARKGPGSIAAGAASQALEWIRNGPFEVPPAASPAVEPMLAVMAHGVPRITASTNFIEHEMDRVWTRRGRTWTVRSLEDSGLEPSDAPSISFETFVTADHSRAIVSVGLTFNPLNGVGYDYLLFRRAGTWRVVGIRPTWIS